METIQKERFTIENVRHDINENVKYENKGQAISFFELIGIIGLGVIWLLLFKIEGMVLIKAFFSFSFFASVINAIILKIKDINIRKSLIPDEIYFTKSILENKYTGTTTIQYFNYFFRARHFRPIINEEVECFLFDFTGENTYRLRFKHFLFSKNFNMSSNSLYVSSEIGDTFYLVRRRDNNEIIFAYPEKLFFPDDSIKIEGAVKKQPNKNTE